MDRIRKKLSAEEEAELLGKIQGWYETDVAGCNSVDESQYNESLNMYLNEQERILGEEWASDVRANLWFIFCERLKSKMTEGRPTVSMTPKGGMKRRFVGRCMNEVWRQDFRDCKAQRKLRDAVGDCSHGGASFWKIMHDEKSGRAKIIALGALNMVAEDGCEEIDDASRIHCLYWLSALQIKEKYGYTDEELNTQEIRTRSREKKHPAGVMNESFTSRDFSPSGVFPSGDGHGRILVDECWHLDGEEETVKEPVIDAFRQPVLDEFGKPMMQSVKRPKYPHGRVTVCTDKRILEDYANDFDLSPVGLRWPFVDIVTIRRERQIVGVPLSTQVDTLQDAFNDFLSVTMDIYRLTGNPKMLITGNPKGLEEMENGPGEQYTVQTGTKVEWIKPPEIPAYTGPFQQLLLYLFDTCSGLREVSAGQNPQGVEANSALRTLISQAESNLRMWAEGIEEAIERTALIMSVIYAKYYTREMVVRIVGKEAQEMLDNYQEYLASVEEMKQIPGFESMGLFARERSREQERSADGRVVSVTFEVMASAVGMYDVELQPDSSLPFSKAQRDQQTRLDFQTGLIDKISAIELLSSIPEGMKNEMIERAEKQMALEQQQADMARVIQQVQRGAGLGVKDVQKQSQGMDNVVGT